MRCRHLSDLETLLSEELKKLVEKQQQQQDSEDIADSSSTINDNKNLRKSTSNNENNNGEFCPLHHLPMNYFCATCQAPVCSDCAIVDNKHKNHNFCSIKEVYQEHLSKIEDELGKLQEKLENSKSLISDVDKVLSFKSDDHF